VKAGSGVEQYELQVGMAGCVKVSPQKYAKN
jgi:hypothetical protein